MSDHRALIEHRRRLKKIRQDAQVLATAIPKSMPILEKRLAREELPWLLGEVARLAEALEEAEEKYESLARVAGVAMADMRTHGDVSKRGDYRAAITELTDRIEREIKENDLVTRAELDAVLARLAAAERERDAARAERDDYRDLYRRSLNERQDLTDALKQVRAATNLALPSEQTGPEWEQCVRVPVARMAAIDAAVAAVLGEPPVTNETKPALHPAAALAAPPHVGIPTGPGTIADALTDPGAHGKTLVQRPDGSYRTVGRARQRKPRAADLEDRRGPASGVSSRRTEGT